MTQIAGGNNKAKKSKMKWNLAIFYNGEHRFVKFSQKVFF